MPAHPFVHAARERLILFRDLGDELPWCDAEQSRPVSVQSPETTYIISALAIIGHADDFPSGQICPIALFRPEEDTTDAGFQPAESADFQLGDDTR
jgi:hypothetical protein